MKIAEIVNGVNCYVATVKIKRIKTTTTAKTIITTQARNLLSAMYSGDSVVSVSKVSESDLHETVTDKTAPAHAPSLSQEYFRQSTPISSHKLPRSIN